MLVQQQQQQQQLTGEWHESLVVLGLAELLHEVLGLVLRQLLA